MTDNVTHVVNDYCGVLHVRVVLQGERYGRDDVLVHDKQDPLVEFFAADVRTDIHGPLGYFVSRYQLSALSADAHRGLRLDGDGEVYSTVNPENLQQAIQFARQRLISTREGAHG